jgi:uncharacterized membrane protein
MYKVFVLLIVVFALAGCDKIADRIAKNYDVTLEPNPVSLAVGGESQVKVIVKVTVGLDINAEPTTVSVFQKPSFLTVEGTTIPGGLGDGFITVKAAANATPGEYEVTLETSKAGLGKRPTLKVTVTP